MGKRLVRVRGGAPGRAWWAGRLTLMRRLPVVAVALVLTLTAALLTHVPAASAKPKPSGGESRKSVVVGKVKPREPKYMGTDGSPIRSLRRKALPRAASAVVKVSGKATKVGDLPVTLTWAAPESIEEELRAARELEAAPAEFRVRVLDQKRARAAGVSGALLELSHGDGKATRAQLRLQVNYWQFANAFGGDYGNRLELRVLPLCSITTPDEPKCRAGKDLGAVNAGGTLSADVTLAETTVLAVTATASSAGGTYGETSLQQSYSWAAGHPSGSFTYSYPIKVPPASVGPVPTVALTYDSGMVDGQSIAQNAQASWVGEGWDLQVGYIERSYRPCKQDGAPSTLEGDLCWFSPNNATMLFGGRAAHLVKDKDTQTWRSANDDGLKIEKLDDSSPDVDGHVDAQNGDNDGEYWKVTAPDGTQYFFGKNKRYDNDNQNTNSVQTVPVYGIGASEPCDNSVCSQAYRWNLDYVLDPRGNSMTYGYNKFSGYYEVGSGGKHFYDLAANLAYIDYGDQAGTEHSKPAPMRVEFEAANRCMDTCGDWEYDKYPDTPWDLYCGPDTPTCGTSPTFFNNKRLGAITTKVWDPVFPPKYRTVDRWVLSHTFPDSGDYILPAGSDTAPNLWLASIQHTGYGWDGTPLTEPKMEFGSQRLPNRVDWRADPDPNKSVAPYMHHRLKSITTGTGSQTIPTYDTKVPGGVSCSVSWTPIPDNNPYLCFPQNHFSGFGTGFGWFHKYVVTSVEEVDLTGGSPPEVTSYEYSNKDSSDSALWGHDYNESVTFDYRTWSLWRGFSTVTARKSGGGSETVNTNVYYRGMDGDGKTSSDGMGKAWDSRRVGLLAPIDTPGLLSGAISGKGGKCLDIRGPSDVNGTPIHLWDCYDGWGQVWQRQGNNIKNTQSGKCLDITGFGTANGTQIQLWTCSSNWNQVWQPQPNGSLKNPSSDKCLDISGWGTANGTKIQLYTCTTSNNWNQVWQPQANQSLLNPQPGRCIDVANSGTTNGTVIQSRECTSTTTSQVLQSSPNQVWQLQANGTLKNPNSQKCLDITAWGTTDGTKIQLYTCTTSNNWNQVWQAQPDGSLKNPQSNKCLDAATNVTGVANGQLVLWACNGSLTQKWAHRFVDSDGLGGYLRESQDLDGTQVSASTIHVPTVTRKATRDAPALGGQEMRAYRVRETTTKARTWLAASSTWRWTEGRASYDNDYGLPTDTQDLGDTATTADDTCVHVDYARNPDPLLVIGYRVGYPSEVTEYAGACGSPTVLSRSRTFYDYTTTLGTPPTKGLRTKTQTLTATDVWATTEAIYDDRGRPTTNKDARGQITNTTYTPSIDLPLKSVTVTNPLSHTATSTFDPGRGQPTELKDTNQKATIIEYDPLGRRTAVWLPSEKKNNGDPPSMKYAYDVSGVAPNKLTTQTLQTKGTTPVYLDSYEFLDGRLRVRNTQTAGPGRIGRIITETRYDGRGLVAAQTAPFYNASTAGAGLTSTPAASVPSQTAYTYDGLGRVKTEALQATGVEKWRTTHSYDGDRHTVTPPSGSVTTTIYDAVERPVRVTVYPGGSTSETTTYAYDTAGNLATVTDDAGNVTRYGYNLVGARTRVEDPDSGTSTSTYNPAGDLSSTTDARGQKISYEYDAIGRVTTRWAGDPNTGTLLAGYIYDEFEGARGQLSRTIRYVGGAAGAQYVVGPAGYDDRYRPTGITWTIPNTEGAALDGTYTTSYGYDSADHLTTITYEAKGGLPAETVTTGYDSAGYPTTAEGVQKYVTATGYTGAGQLASRTYGDPGAGQLIRTYDWDPATGRLAGISATLPDPAVPETRKTVQNDRYSYLPAGDISSVKDLTDGQSQCYRYDGLHRLTEAFTATDDCAADPTDIAATGKHPYWDSYTFDNAGRRATDTHRTATATTNRTYNYPAAGQARPHAMTSIAVTGSTTRTDTFGYDPAGNINTRTVAGITSTYTINPEGRFDTATVSATSGQEQTKHLYDADGALLIRTDPTGKTLYLAGEELKADGNQATATRYYSHNGATIAARTSNGLAWLAADHQASANLTVDPNTGTIQRRWYTPYGADRTEVTTWPTDRGFLGAQTNPSTQLLDVGAREYDPDTGTFIAPDPLIDLANPNSFNPYAYAHHNPITLSDPSGLMPVPDGEPAFNDDVDTAAAIIVTVVVTVGVLFVCTGTAGACLLGAGLVGLSVGTAAALAEPGHRTQAALIAAGAAALGGGVGNGVRLLAIKAGVAGGSRTLQGIAGAAAGITESAAVQSATAGSIDWRQALLAGAAGGALGAAIKPRPSCLHSFAPTTPVLMADGSTKPIQNVEVGDQVTATDPETGETGAQPVEQLHANHDTDLTDLTVTVEDNTPAEGTDNSTTTVLETTQHHPFWDETTSEWVYAADLVVGHELRTANGDIVTVTGVRSYSGGKDMRDLTVADVHTYYVIAGNTPVLVHNCGLDNASADDLYKLATDGGSPSKLSPAGRGIQKHSAPNRPQVQRDKYDYGANNNSDRNEVGDILIQEILTDPNAARSVNHGAPAHYGGSQLDIRMGNGIGARWSMRGGRITFEGFL